MNLEKQQLLSLSTIVCKEPAATLSTDAFVVLFITSPAEKALCCSTLMRCQGTAGGYSEANCSLWLMPMMFGPSSFHKLEARQQCPDGWITSGLSPAPFQPLLQPTGMTKMWICGYWSERWVRLTDAPANVCGFGGTLPSRGSCSHHSAPVLHG